MAAAAGPSPDDIIKILITSDNHVGYAEKDEIRGGDSFTSFEEVLKIARDEKVRPASVSASLSLSLSLPLSLSLSLSLSVCVYVCLCV